MDNSVTYYVIEAIDFSPYPLADICENDKTASVEKAKEIFSNRVDNAFDFVELVERRIEICGDDVRIFDTIIDKKGTRY